LLWRSQQVVAGSYVPSPGGKSIKAKLEPQAIEVSLQNLREIIAGVESATGAVNVLIQDLETQTKQPEESPPR